MAKLKIISKNNEYNATTLTILLHPHGLDIWIMIIPSLPGQLAPLSTQRRLEAKGDYLYAVLVMSEVH